MWVWCTVVSVVRECMEWRRCGCGGPQLVLSGSAQSGGGVVVVGVVEMCDVVVQLW